MRWMVFQCVGVEDMDPTRARVEMNLFPAVIDRGCSVPVVELKFSGTW